MKSLAWPEIAALLERHADEPTTNHIVFRQPASITARGLSVPEINALVLAEVRAHQADPLYVSQWIKYLS